MSSVSPQGRIPEGGELGEPPSLTANGKRTVAQPSRSRRSKLARFIIQRLVLGVLTLFLASIIVFGATQALPGDAARAILGRDAPPERLEIVRERLNLNRPIVAQYWSWLSGVLTGDLGSSLRTTVTGVAGQAPAVQTGEQSVGTHTSVAELIADRLGNSAFLVGLASLIAFPLSILIGALSAYRRDTVFDHVNSFISVALAALPEFVIGITLVLVFSTTVFHVLPAVAVVQSGIPVWRQLRDLILPVLALVIYEAPYVSRIMRASMIEVLESDYIEMARLKGLPEWRVVSRHALPNAIIPTMHVIAVQLAVLIGGVAVIEVVFGFPGIGLTLVDAVANRDLPVVQAISLVIAGAYILVNMFADVATILLSPRLRSSFS